jgi:hypothetical protein
MLVLAYTNGFWVNFTNSAKGSEIFSIETEPLTVTS